MAAAGIYALENNVHRLAEDHANAALLADGLAEIDELQIDPAGAQTNMVFVRLDKPTDQLPDFLRQHGILVPGGPSIRLVTHLDVSEKDIRIVIASFKEFFSTTRV